MVGPWCRLHEVRDSRRWTPGGMIRWGAGGALEVGLWRNCGISGGCEWGWTVNGAQEASGTQKVPPPSHRGRVLEDHFP